MAQLNDWLSIDKTSGTGNAQITLSASSYNELVERTQSLVIKGQKIKVYLGVKQLPFIETSSNTVFYTTVNGKKYDYDNDWYFSNMFIGENGDANIISHTYENGIGKVVYDVDIVRMRGIVDTGWWNKHPKERDTYVYYDADEEYVTAAFYVKQEKEVLPITFDGHTIRCGAEGGSITLEKWHNESVDFSRVNNANTFIKVYPTHYEANEDLTVIVEPSTVHLLETVILPNKLTNIGQGAFAGQYFLSSVTIPSSVTRIEDDAFSFCNNLSEITLGNNIEEIGSSCFYSCKSLETMYLPQSIKNMGSNNFGWCENLKSITFDFPMVNIPQDTFYECINLRTVSLPNTIVNIYRSAFFGCASLETFTLPDTVKYVGVGAFQQCTNLKNIQLSENLTTIDENAFSECSSLVSIKLPKTLLSVGSGSFAFCNSLESIELNNPFTTFVVDGENETVLDSFWRVKEGGTLYYPSNIPQPSILDGIEGDLGYYNWIGSATLPSFNYKDMYPNYIKYKTDDGNSAVILKKQFNDLYTVANYYDETDGYWYECYNRPLTTTNSMYMSLPSNVTEVVLPNTIETLDNIFDGSKVSEVIIPDSVKTIYTYALTSENIKKVVFGNGIAELDLDSCFNANIKSIEELTVPEGVTSITASTFGLVNVTKLSLPTTLTTIGNNCFYKTQNISVQEILSGLPNLEVIGENAFYGCKTDGVTIVIPSTVKQIGKDGLNISEVYEYIFEGELTELNAFFGLIRSTFCIRFSQNTPPTVNLPSNYAGEATIFVPSDAKSVYDEWVKTVNDYWVCAVDIENPNYFWVEMENTNGNVNIDATRDKTLYSFNKTNWYLLEENGVNMDGHNKVYFNNLTRNMYLSFNLIVSDYYSMGGNLNTLVDKRIATEFDCEYLFKDDVLLKDVSELELGLTEIPASYCEQMFRGCTSLLKAPSINVTKIGTEGFREMFYGCTSLVSVGSINADIVESKGCYDMFNGCTNLSVIPTSITATSVGESGFSYMFRNCSSITKSPTITVSEVDSYCFRSMFSGCASLVEASPIQIGNLSEYCCYYMFNGCTSLATAPELPLTVLARSCYSNMFAGCTSLTTAPILRADKLVDYCYSNMFNGCSNLNYIKMLATDVSAQSALSYWVNGVSATGTFVKHPDAVIPSGNKGIPNGWTVETATS